MTNRYATRTIGTVAALVAAGLSPLAPAALSAAAPSGADAFDVAFVDGSCGTDLDAAVALHVQFVDRVLPDGSVHHWVDLKGTIANESADRVVTLHAARRFTDAASGDASTFRGLQSQFSAPGVGVLLHTSGWSDGALSRGRWDATPSNSLPAAVCSYLFS